MSKTTIMKDNFKYLIAAAEIKVQNLNTEVYENGNTNMEYQLNYWQGKLDGLKFASSFEDDFLLLNLAEMLKRKGYKEAAKYLISLTEE